MTNKELMQMALDALEKHVHEYEAIEALRIALAQPEPEPVAWGILNTRPTEKQPLMMVMLDEPEPSHLVVPLYTAPPQHESTCAECDKKQSDGWALYCVDCLREFYKHDPTNKREWVELTDEEMCDIRGRVQEYTPIDAIEYGKVLQFFTAEALEDKNI